MPPETEDHMPNYRVGLEKFFVGVLFSSWEEIYYLMWFLGGIFE